MKAIRHPLFSLSQRLGGLLLGIFLPQILYGQDASYNAVLSRNPVPLGESTTLQLRYNNCEPDQRPEIPKIDGLTITYAGPSRSRNIQIINRRTIESNLTIYQYDITPEKVGMYEIPPIEFQINGKAYHTKSLPLNVSKGVDYSQYAFLQVHIPKQETKQKTYLGEVFPISIHFNYLSTAKLEESPTISSDGFVISEAGRPSQRRVSQNNRIYNRVTFNYLARAVKTGDLTIGPVALKVALFFRDNSRRQRDLFDSFFSDSFFNNNTIRRDVTLRSEPVSINALPLPIEERPNSFNGAVGDYSHMKVNASPTTVAAGDPVTITMTIHGEGALESLSMPSLDSWREFQQYPETATINYSDEIGLRGVKTFEKIVIPNNAEIQSLPEIEFSFFDPQEEQYKTLRQSPIPLTVKPNMTEASQSVVAADGEKDGDIPRVANNIVHIKPHLGGIVDSSRPWLWQPWFLGLQAIPVIAWIACWFYRSRRNALHKNPRALRRKRVKTIVDEGIQTLENMAAENRSDEFFAVLFRLLQEQIGERLNLPANAITESVIETKLRNCGLEPEISQSLDHLFQACNQARYAPIDSSKELAQIAATAESALRGLQSLPMPHDQ